MHKLAHIIRREKIGNPNLLLLLLQMTTITMVITTAATISTITTTTTPIIIPGKINNSSRIKSADLINSKTALFASSLSSFLYYVVLQVLKHDQL